MLLIFMRTQLYIKLIEHLTVLNKYMKQLLIVANMSPMHARQQY